MALTEMKYVLIESTFIQHPGDQHFKHEGNKI